MTIYVLIDLSLMPEKKWYAHEQIDGYKCIRTTIIFIDKNPIVVRLAFRIGINNIYLVIIYNIFIISCKSITVII